MIRAWNFRLPEMFDRFHPHLKISECPHLNFNIVWELQIDIKDVPHRIFMHFNGGTPIEYMYRKFISFAWEALLRKAGEWPAQQYHWNFITGEIYV